MRSTEKTFPEGEKPHLVLVKNGDAEKGAFEETVTEEFEAAEAEVEADESEEYESAADGYAPDYDSEDEVYPPDEYDDYDGEYDDRDEYDDGYEYDDYDEYDDSGEYAEDGEYDDFGEYDETPDPVSTPAPEAAPGTSPVPSGESAQENNSKTKGKEPKARKKGFFRKHIKAIILILILIIAAAVGIFIFMKKRSAQDFSAFPMQTFSMVERMDISNSLAVTGTVSAKKVRNVSTLVSNTKVKSVSVEVGDYVEEGDPICTFDTANIEEKIARLQKQMYVATSKSVLNEMEANTKLAWTLEDAFETAEAQREKVEAARRSYDAAERELGEKEKELEEAEEDYEDDDSDINEKAVRQAKLAVASAKDQVASAIDSYNDAVRAQIDDTENSVRTISQNQEAILNTGLDNMTTNDSSNTELDELQRQLENCVVTAPVSGLVTSVSVEVGEEYSEKSTICVIQDDSVYLVKGTVDQYDISQIKEGLSAVIKTESTGDDELEGDVTFVAPVPESSSSGTSSTTGGSSGSSSSSTEYPVEITLKGKDDRLRLGMTAETSVLIAKRENVLAVPYDCVVEEGDENVVYVAENEGPDFGEDGMPSPPDGMEMPEGAERPSKGFSLRTVKETVKGFFTKLIPSSTTEETPITPTKRVVVEKGLETDYYIEVISDELKEGDEVLVSDGGMDSGSGFGFDMGGPPPGGGF
ncbi:MAG: HlyD family efflux transporter periplasmic adaptor subunit [Lachnospiraceae bacterium]|nr:HlyD family efflux transporter periplasmic adaptor subunit [Lachnospiraceae bacterium]